MSGEDAADGNGVDAGGDDRVDAADRDGVGTDGDDRADAADRDRVGTDGDDRADAADRDRVGTDGGERVDAAEVRHVADLARVSLADDEVDRFAGQFADILDAFAALDEVPDVDGEPELTNVLRPDEVEPSLDRETALRNAPEHEEGYFRGPPVS